MDCYLDASVLLPRLIIEPDTPAVDQFLLGWTDGLVVSEFAAAEVGSAISRLVRMGMLPANDGLATLADFDTWRGARAIATEIETADVRLAGVFVRRFDLMLRAPDALHAAICRRLGLMLVTLDQRLAAAAGALGLTVIIPKP
jgi:hypothetical protein